MKYVVLVVAVLALLWMLKGVRRRVPPPDAERGPPQAVQDMVACPQCGVHTPRADALPGRGGDFCCEEHRAEYEKSHSAA